MIEGLLTILILIWKLIFLVIGIAVGLWILWVVALIIGMNCICVGLAIYDFMHSDTYD